MMPPETLHIFCAGACQSLLNQIRLRLPMPLRVEFGPVGRLSDLLRADRTADILLSSRPALEALVHDGYVEEASIQVVGRVPTSMAGRSEASGATLSATDGDATQFAKTVLDIAHVYLPDTRRATAGIHMLKLFESLGMAGALAPRLHELPNGAAAIAKMVEDGFASAIGFAQRTEIIATPGAFPAGDLPQGYELVTEYCSALIRKPLVHPQARAFLATLRRHNSPGLRHLLGFLDTDGLF
jgi:molybdate transport system substrate-binding protein